MIFPWFSHDIPIVYPCFSLFFPWFSHSNPPWLSMAPMAPMASPHLRRPSRRQGLDLASNALDDDASFEDLEQLRFLVSWTTAMNGYNGRMEYMIYIYIISINCIIYIDYMDNYTYIIWIWIIYICITSLSKHTDLRWGDVDDFLVYCGSYC